ncbi:uncharacterized protein LOC133816222 [Humulus lupulus]|uniref:uncharacterized protein LOC133816222 n=1 Tax=Humulus lupulus TaxID=3486 RepID=UPI002B418577|nr:uncharacterized protein LOC133816222 [Humulus lupulus]
MDNRTEIISERINNTVMGQTWLMPYHFLRHWMLVIIDPDDHTCYYLDPLRKSPPNDLKNLMNSVVGRIHIHMAKLMKLEMNGQPSFLSGCVIARVTFEIRIKKYTNCSF